MLNYVQRAKQAFHKNNDKEEYITLVWDGIKRNARKSHIVERATDIFLELYELQRHPRISGTEIFKLLRLKYNLAYSNRNSHGLWPWLEKKDNAAVIKQEKDGVETWYSVFDKFYPALRDVVKGKYKSKLNRI